MLLGFNREPRKTVKQTHLRGRKYARMVSMLARRGRCARRRGARTRASHNKSDHRVFAGNTPKGKGREWQNCEDLRAVQNKRSRNQAVNLSQIYSSATSRVGDLELSE